ncbi:low specificity L-threonine aldolase [Niveibacterium umoris]|uniref:L-threonine aldolase n=1 Tax=Niveibacterium umoris TaxID=1193620 RepID=A0A840BR98_9RHOO|nr:low specificity L-threonine aldolase [Niveibacterium umoris]MBB4014202.1 threonine aldolase [Niveibacterium umoris]
MQHTEFASDNTAGICPEAMEALLAANSGHMASYGNDDWTRRACDAIRATFETDCEVFFVFNGTAANSLALASLCQSYHSIVCHKLAHVETDECGGPEFFSNGTKLLLAGGADGKLDMRGVEKLISARSDIHYPKPRAVTITQSTEVGTVYSLEEVRALGEGCREHDLAFHMDGARFANAVASLGVSPADITWRAGVDVLSFGGTKMGMPVGEAVVFFDHDMAKDFAYRCKQAGQLASKMRFLSAPWVGMLAENAWLTRAAHANAMARRLGNALARLPGIAPLFPVQSNAVFVSMPQHAADALKEKGWAFYSFIGAGGARFVCSWATQPEQVDALVADVKACLA